MTTPSISAPSSLFQVMSSRLPRSPHAASWAVMSVTRSGAPAPRVQRKISATVVRSSPWSATVEPSRERSAEEIISGVSSASVASPDSGSITNSWRAVRWEATKKTPSSFHASGDGFSSNPAVRTREAPPAAGMTASSEFP